MHNVHCNTVKFCARLCRYVQFCAMQFFAIPCSAILCNSVQCNSVQFHTVKFCVQCNAGLLARCVKPGHDKGGKKRVESGGKPKIRMQTNRNSKHECKQKEIQNMNGSKNKFKIQNTNANKYKCKIHKCMNTFFKINFCVAHILHFIG